jgi:hypothetical protein
LCRCRRASATCCNRSPSTAPRSRIPQRTFHERGRGAGGAAPGLASLTAKLREQ